MSSKRTYLFYIAGDVTNYNVVEYRFRESKCCTFFSAHALYHMLKPEKVVALLPDSLIDAETNCGDNVEVIKKAYRNMLRNRLEELQKDQQSGSSCDFNACRASFDEFLNKLEVEYIPNVGTASSKVTDCQGNLLLVDAQSRKYRIKPYSRSRSPTFIYNVVYAILKKYSGEFDSLAIDLTHGTNVLGSVLLTASAQFEDVKLYAAPIMGPPSGGVEVVELTELVEAMRDSLKIDLSVEKLDERYLVDYTSKLKRLNPNEFGNYKELINRIKRVDLNQVNTFLWNLRNGFVVRGLNSMEELQRHLAELRGDVQKLSEIYAEWYKRASGAFEKDDKIILSNFFSTLSVEGLISSLKGNDDIETMLRLLDKYIEVEYYDKALSLGRELPVAECLSNHGGGTFDDENNVYADCNELVTRYLRLNHSEMLTYRNYLMHSGLSKDLKVKVEGRKVKEEQEGVDRSDIVNYVKGQLRNHVEDVRRIV